MVARYSWGNVTDLSDIDLKDTMEKYRDYSGDNVGEPSFKFYHDHYLELRTEFYRRHKEQNAI